MWGRSKENKQQTKKYGTSEPNVSTLETIQCSTPYDVVRVRSMMRVLKVWGLSQNTRRQAGARTAPFYAAKSGTPQTSRREEEGFQEENS